MSDLTPYSDLTGLGCPTADVRTVAAAVVPPLLPGPVEAISGAVETYEQVMARIALRRLDGAK